MTVGNSGKILTSTEGISWTLTTSETSTNMTGITYGNNIYVATGTSGIFTSLDGNLWTLRKSAFI